MIHQPSHLVMCCLTAFLGLVYLGRLLFAWRKRQMAGQNGAWSSLATATLWVWIAASHGSNALDLPHHYSHRTQWVDGAGLAVVMLSLFASLWADRRAKALKAQAKNAQNMGQKP